MFTLSYKMHSLQLCLVIGFYILCVPALPYTVHQGDYSQRDCHGVVCPEGTKTCTKNSEMTDRRDVMTAVIMCRDINGNPLLKKTVQEPVKEKNGPIKVFTSSTVIEIKGLRFKPQNSI